MKHAINTEALDEVIDSLLMSIDPVGRHITFDMSQSFVDWVSNYEYYADLRGIIIMIACGDQGLPNYPDTDKLNNIMFKFLEIPKDQQAYFSEALYPLPERTGVHYASIKLNQVVQMLRNLRDTGEIDWEHCPQYDESLIKLSVPPTEIKLVDTIPSPGGRFRENGPFSGEYFREDILVPALVNAIKTNGKVIVTLDGAPGYAWSFLEEVFGGLVRKHHFTARQLSRILEISNSDISYNEYTKKAYDYIKVA